jgi:hypothetical protein
MNHLHHILLAVAAILALPSLAHAYADPGAGSLLLQLLVGGAAGLFVAFRLFREKILRLFGIRKTDDNQ